jgi:hypothetical protein
LQCVDKKIYNFTDEQLQIVKRLCKLDTFTVSSILDATGLIRKFGVGRILALRSFVDLDDLQPGALNRFLFSSLPRGNRNQMDEEEWAAEVREKMMSKDQINVFYNICNRIPDITTTTAIDLLPGIRQMQPQHCRIMNHFSNRRQRVCRQTHQQQDH